jgi:TolB-like protein
LIYQFDDYSLDVDRQELWRGTELIDVEPQVLDLLQYLIRHRERVVSKDDLIKHVWHGRIVSESTLTSRITAVRHAIGDSGDHQRLIRTIARKGIRFVGKVRGDQSSAERSSTADTTPSSPVATAPRPRDKPSIAVLPFANMSGDPEQEYFADGMVEEIITGLSRIKWLFVIARNSSFTYKGRAVDVKQVGRELGVRYILEGSVRKSGDRVRITTQLVEAETGRHLWAERYDRPIGDIFTLQDEITLSVVGAIEPSLRSAEVERAKRKRPDSLEAYDLVLQALPDVYSRMPEQEKEALVLLRRALAIDPNYALAHACAAHSYHTLFLRGGQNAEDRVAAIRHARSAIAHGQDDALALAFAGFILGIDAHDRAAAFAAFDAALAISPSTALTYIFGSIILRFAGDDRASEWAERGLRLSPFDPWRSSAFNTMALGHFHHGQYEEAVTAGRKAVQSSPGLSICHVFLAAPLAQLGRLEEAKAAAARVLELQPTFRYSRFLTGVGCEPGLAASLSKALSDAGLPE